MMLTVHDAKNLLVLLNMAMTKGVYNLDHSGHLATLASKLVALIKEADDVQDSDSGGQPRGAESPALNG
jgi:hypothetical protein